LRNYNPFTHALIGLFDAGLTDNLEDKSADRRASPKEIITGHIGVDIGGTASRQELNLAG
jgi:hypothetical protein